MSRGPLTIAGIQVPHAVCRKWGTRATTDAEEQAFLAGYHGEPALTPTDGAGYWERYFLRCWHWRGRAVRQWELEGAAEVEAKKRNRERAEAERAAWRAEFEEQGQAAWRAGLTLRSNPYRDGDSRRKAWRAGWLAERYEFYRALARELR